MLALAGCGKAMAGLSLAPAKFMSLCAALAMGRGEDEGRNHSGPPFPVYSSCCCQDHSLNKGGCRTRLILGSDAKQNLCLN